MLNKFKKNDEVIIISGSDKGKIGKVKSIKGSRILVEGVNMATVHKKPTSNTPGQIIKTEKSVHSSNVSHVEGGKPVKIKIVTESGDGKNFTKKSRVSKKSGKKLAN